MGSISLSVVERYPGYGGAIFCHTVYILGRKRLSVASYSLVALTLCNDSRLETFFCSLWQRFSSIVKHLF